jgi:hypothetical protein
MFGWALIAVNSRSPMMVNNRVQPPANAAPHAWDTDIHMQTARPEQTQSKSQVFQLWERELLDSPEVKRKATVAQLCPLALIARDSSVSHSTRSDRLSRLLFLFLGLHFESKETERILRHRHCLQASLQVRVREGVQVVLRARKSRLATKADQAKG